MRNILICGDLLWGLSGDPSSHPVACDIIGAAVKKVVVKAKAKPKAIGKAKPKPAPKPEPKASIFTKAKAVATKAAKVTAQNRADLAKKRLAKRPPAKVAKAKTTAAKLKALPPVAQKAAVLSMAKQFAERPAQPSVAFNPPEPAAPNFMTSQPAQTGPDYSPVVTERQPFDLNPPADSYTADEEAEELQDVADAVWEEQAYDVEVDAEESPEEDDTEGEDEEEDAEDETYLEADEAEFSGDEMHENEIQDMVGWNPFTAIKKGIQKGASFVSKVAKSDIMKATAAGLAIVYPPVGAPLSTTLPIAAGIADAVKSKDPKKRAAAIKVVKNTHALAKKGDKDAGRALSTIAMMTKLKAPTTNDTWKKAVIKALAAA